MKKSIVSIITALLFLYASAHATTWYVHPDSALNTIQAGLDSCADNDVVLVGPGTYYENIVWPNTQGIHLISELGPEMTTIDGDSEGSVIAITVQVETTTIISGFMIQNGYADCGGGIFCDSASAPQITCNTFKGNVGIYLGGGIFCSGGLPVIVGNIITGNKAWGYDACGGGICCITDSATIIGNTITANNALWKGGGISCYYSSSVIKDNTITRNNAGIYGGGIDCGGDSLIIENNIISENTAGDTIGTSGFGGGISCGNSSAIIKNCSITENIGGVGGIYCQGGAPTIDSCIISNNEGDGVGCFQSNPIINSTHVNNNTGGGINCYISSPVINSCSISYNSNYGVHCTRNSNLLINFCTISNNNNDGVICAYNVHGASNPIINNSNIIENIGCGVRNTDYNTTTNAEDNWWGDSSGPYHPTLNPGGLGDTVSDYVNFDPWLLEPVFLGIQEYEPSQAMTTYLQISPNPFTHSTQISYEILEAVDSRQKSVVSIKIYEITGRMIKEFNQLTNHQSSINHISWDGTDSSNRKLPSGVYFLKFTAGDYTETRKLLFIK